MSAASTSTSAPLERDLTVHQKSLADNCFDEGQYEAAIDALDQNRSRKNKPYDAHIRQLLYIALYPPPSLEDQIEEEVMKLEPGSPSKLLSRRHKSSLSPSPKATVAAQDLLMKFARTNTPESLACALPSYPDSLNASPNDTVGSEDSYIAREALRVRNARCCWDIIKEGFIPRGNGDVTASPRKSKGRRSRRVQLQDDDDEGEDTAAPAPVSDHAWSVLGWILTLFENNEAAMERNGQVRYSPLLLRQIPPSRPETAPRWDVRMPLDVAFHALEQEREAQRSLGVRLLASLINLTSTAFIDFTMFLNTVSTRVSSLPLDTLSYLFAALPLTRTMAQFKVMLCRQALGGNQTASGKGPKPQARARAQPRRRNRTDSSADAGAEKGAAPSASTSAPPPPSTLTQDEVGTGGFQYPTISAADLLDLLARAGKGDRASVLRTICLKCELVVSFGWVQQELGENDRDAGWEGVVRDGSLARAVEDVFDTGRRWTTADVQSKEFIRTKRDALLAIVSMWSPA